MEYWFQINRIKLLETWFCSDSSSNCMEYPPYADYLETYPYTYHNCFGLHAQDISSTCSLGVLLGYDNVGNKTACTPDEIINSSRNFETISYAVQK